MSDWWRENLLWWLNTGLCLTFGFLIRHWWWKPGMKKVGKVVDNGYGNVVSTGSYAPTTRRRVREIRNGIPGEWRDVEDERD